MSVACIVTSFNNARWLRRCIESLLQQTRPVDEIVIADDASNDGSRDVIGSLVREHGEGITPILRERNLGVASNRDLAIRAARAAVFTTIDGDDVFYPEKIERELDLLEGQKAAAVAFSGVALMDSCERVFDHFNCLNTEVPRARLIEDFMFRRGHLPHNMTLTKELYLRTGGFRHHMRMYEDFELKLRLAREAERWLYTGYVGLGYRRHGQGLSSARRLTHKYWLARAVWENRSWLVPIFGRAQVYSAYGNLLAGQRVRGLARRVVRPLAP